MENIQAAYMLVWAAWEGQHAYKHIYGVVQTHYIKPHWWVVASHTEKLERHSQALAH
jgi:hypothetical protein